MRRAPIVLSATALGLAATLGFNTHHNQSSATTAAVTTTSSSPSSSSSAKTAASSSSSAKTVTSDAIATRYGDVRLKVTVSGGKITNIIALQLPADDPKSQQIGSSAEPLLRQSALSNQDGTVDAVSGATFTTAGYRQALQSALDKAGFRAASETTTGAAA